MKVVENACEWQGTCLSQPHGSARNRVISCGADEAMPDELREDASWGYGCTAVQLQDCSELIRDLRDADPALHERLRDAMPLDSAPYTRVQLSLSDPLDTPAFHDERTTSVVLMAWGHDHLHAHEAVEAIRQRSTACADKLVRFTMSDLADTGLIQACAESGYAARVHLLDAVVEQLRQHYKAFAEAPLQLLNVNQFKIKPGAGNVYRVAMDANVDSTAVVFHSPERGSTVVYGSDRTECAYPASDGSRVSYARDATVADGIEPLRDAVARVRSEAHNPGLGGCIVSHATGTNRHVTVERSEASHADQSLVDILKRAPAGAKVVRLRALLTVMPGTRSVGDALYSCVPCNTFADLLATVDSDEKELCIPNTAHWREMLINADEQGAPFRLMNGETATRLDAKGKVLSYRLDRATVEGIA